MRGRSDGKRETGHNRETGHHTAPTPATCPHCQQELPTEDGQAWRPVARLADLAEAGFMANLLADVGVPSRIRQYDDFSAVDGHWASIYVLQVPEHQARQAVDQIGRELAKSPPEPLQQGSAADEASPDKPPAVAWRPVAWVLVAGGLAYLAGQSGLGQREPATPPDARTTLWKAVERIGTPLSSEPVPGRPRFRLSFDAATEQFLLDGDHDGDGRYEERRRFFTKAVPPRR